MNKNYIAIRKSGKFYNVFDDDALIFNYLFNYNIINYKAGFPESAYQKVINKLEDYSISYKVLSEPIVEKNFKTKNSYKQVLLKSKENYKFIEVLNTIYSKLEKLSYEELIKVISILEEEVL